MKHLLSVLLLTPLTVMAQVLPTATPVAPGTCTIVGNSLVTDMRDSNCFPAFDEAKCSYYALVPVSKIVGAAKADVESTKKHGVQIMKYAASQVCEGRANCGFYVASFASAASCAGTAEQNMPGGEYRGLTASTARNLQARINRELEAASKEGMDRGKATKNPKNKGKVWGAEE